MKPRHAYCRDVILQCGQPGPCVSENICGLDYSVVLRCPEIVTQDGGQTLKCTAGNQRENCVLCSRHLLRDYIECAEQARSSSKLALFWCRFAMTPAPRATKLRRPPPACAVGPTRITQSSSLVFHSPWRTMEETRAEAPVGAEVEAALVVVDAETGVVLASRPRELEAATPPRTWRLRSCIDPYSTRQPRRSGGMSPNWSCPVFPTTARSSR